MLCFDNGSPEKSCFVVDLVCFCFALPISCYVPECHQKELKSSTAEKVFCFFRFRGRLSGKTDEGKKFTIAEGTVKVCSFRLEDLRQCVSDRI